MSEDVAVELRLTEPADLLAHWFEPDLLLSQTCGYPLLHALKHRVRLVATPCYSAPGCQGALYSSVWIVRDDDAAETLEDLRGRRAAFNARDSQSGYNALRHAVAPLSLHGRFFGETIETGAHRLSMESVQRGDADVAAIDCVTFALAQDAGRTGGLRVLGRSQAVPSLPFITSLQTTDVELASLRRALEKVGQMDGVAPALKAMRLTGFVTLKTSDYAPIAAMEASAIAAGYPVLA
ncbi:MAG: PhnD/SsuA/transferrin family substrate-binding protein [Rhizobiaceae bacterium]|nr:PhnD/SsuA/transferrin family substrate-binding protein [Rhizobiaceae bacterium]